MRPLRKTTLRSSGAGFLGLLGAALALGPCARADMGDGARRYQDDLRLLSTRVAEYRFALRASAQGAQRLAVIDVELARLKANVGELVVAAGELDAQDRHLRFLRERDEDPDQGDPGQPPEAEAQQAEQLRQEKAALDARWAAYDAQRHAYETPRESAAYAADCALYGAIKEEERRYLADRARAQEETGGLPGEAAQATPQAQQELGDAQAKREQTAQELKDLAEQYGANRAPLVEQLVDLDRAPPVPRMRPPLGPGADAHALDELSVVDASAPGRQGSPAAAAAAPATYAFDSAIDTAPVPDRTPPEARPAAPPVPLVVAAQGDLPAAAGESQRLQQAAQGQAEGLKALAHLYEERRGLALQGPAASPDDWARVVKEISTAHAEISMDAVVKKLSKGSRFVEATAAPAPSPPAPAPR